MTKSIITKLLLVITLCVVCFGEVGYGATKQEFEMRKKALELKIAEVAKEYLGVGGCYRKAQRKHNEASVLKLWSAVKIAKKTGDKEKIKTAYQNYYRNLLRVLEAIERHVDSECKKPLLKKTKAPQKKSDIASIKEAAKNEEVSLPKSKKKAEAAPETASTPRKEAKKTHPTDPKAKKPGKGTAAAAGATGAAVGAGATAATTTADKGDAPASTEQGAAPSAEGASSPEGTTEASATASENAPESTIDSTNDSSGTEGENEEENTQEESETQTNSENEGGDAEGTENTSESLSADITKGGETEENKSKCKKDDKKCMEEELTQKEEALKEAANKKDPEAAKKVLGSREDIEKTEGTVAEGQDEATALGKKGPALAAIYNMSRKTESFSLKRLTVGKENTLTILDQNEERNIISRIIKMLAGILGTFGVLMMVVGGLFMVGSRGDENAWQKGRQIFIYTAMGLVIGFVSYMIVQLVISVVFKLME